MMNKYTALIAIALLLPLSACSNPREANKDNFKKALNEDFKDNPACLLRGVSFPVQGTLLKLAGRTEGISSDLHFYNAKKTYDTLVGLKLLKVQQTERTLGSVGVETTYIYELTEEGQKIFQPPKGFCYGTAEAIEVTNFTVPTDTPEGKQSKVEFRFRIKPTVSWADRLAEQIGRGDVLALSQPVPSYVVMILADNGWQPQMDLPDSTQQ